VSAPLGRARKKKSQPSHKKNDRCDTLFLAFCLVISRNHRIFGANCKANLSDSYRNYG